MASKRATKQCNVWEKNLQEIINKALKVYKEQEEAVKAAESANRALQSCGLSGVSTYELVSAGKKNMLKAEDTALRETKNWLKSVDDTIGEEFNALNVQDVQYMIQWLEKCAPIPRKLVYNSKLQKMKGVGDIIKPAAENWQKKALTDKNFRKAVLNQRRESLEKQLEEDKARLELLEKKVGTFHGSIPKFVYTTNMH